ncbi:hypothetical protein K438DRAFT_1852192 [Mycena galopus ATCC 62051]|nr:hypothetical protein K438DRAFT_1852192 [Mycena galopus ATCC 62051]
MSVVCGHRTLSFDCSPYSAQAGYTRPTAKEREDAASLPQSVSKGKLKRAAPDDAEDVDPFTFCAPLVLPGDDLAEDPEYPPQSLEEWRTDEDRNEVKPGKNTIYVSWTEPQHAENGIPVEAPKIEDVADYLKAFYHGMPVKLLPPPALRLAHWGEGKVSKTPRYIGLKTATECVRIRTRASRDGVFERQLNLDDLLDAAISILPSDAFALLLLVPFDIYESPDDDFGLRAGVWRQSYHPGLDRYQNVDRLHSWPASHCKQFIDAFCAQTDDPKPKKQKNGKLKAPVDSLQDPATYAALSPLHAAVVAHEALPSLEESPSSAALAALWLGRACRTASHELGHCIGIDHCVNYACCMQGTAGLAEDARQPPFLCPVDLAKMLCASGADREERYRTILDFCGKHPQCHLFVAFGAWIRAQLSEHSVKRTKTTDEEV